MYIKDANIIIVVYDISSRASFDHLKVWLNDLKELKKENAIIAFIGNKSDLNSKEVTNEDMDQVQKDTGYLHSTLSAITGDGVEYFFEQLFIEISKVFDLQSKDSNDDLNVTEKFELYKIKRTCSKKKCCKYNI